MIPNSARATSGMGAYLLVVSLWYFLKQCIVYEVCFKFIEFILYIDFYVWV